MCTLILILMYKLCEKSAGYYQQPLYQISSILSIRCQYVRTSIDYGIKCKQLVALSFHITKGKVFYFLHLIKVTAPTGRHCTTMNVFFLKKLFQIYSKALSVVIKQSKPKCSTNPNDQALEKKYSGKEGSMIVYACNTKSFAIVILFFFLFLLPKAVLWTDWKMLFVNFSSIAALSTCDQGRIYKQDMPCAFKSCPLKINSKGRF